MSESLVAVRLNGGYGNYFYLQPTVTFLRLYI
nr:MAG TPA: hypothetical protein [Caudoviricetes sp.]